MPRLLFLLFCKLIGFLDSNLIINFSSRVHEVSQKASICEVWPPNYQCLVPERKSPIICWDVRGLMPEEETTWDFKQNQSEQQVLGTSHAACLQFFGYDVNWKKWSLKYPGNFYLYLVLLFAVWHAVACLPLLPLIVFLGILSSLRHSALSLPFCPPEPCCWAHCPEAHPPSPR